VSVQAPPGGLTAVVPCFNEGEQVARAYAAICAGLGEVEDLEILLVDDGSRDDTLARIRELAAADPRVHYLSFTRNFGLEAAHAAGFRYAARPWAVQLDADLQSPPEETWALVAKAAEGYDVVFGIRSDRHDPLLRRLGSSGQQWVARVLLGIDLPAGASTFRLVRTAVARRLVDLRLGSPYFLAMVPMLGARYACVPTEHRPRTSGRSGWRVARLVGHSFELFFGYSWRPLNAVYLLAALVAPLALLGALAGLLGLASSLALAELGLAVGAATLVAAALVGRYLHRLLLDQRHPRQYYVQEANVPLRPEDTLDGGEPVAPLPARRSVVPAPRTTGVDAGAAR
jgi:glycosyltransferase involved in cell wall biosynthesis